MLGLQCGKLQNTLWDYAASKQKQRSCFHLFFLRKKRWKKKKKMEQSEQSVPWSFKRMCTKKCEQENMAKGREKNFCSFFFPCIFFRRKKAAHPCASRVNVEKIPSFFFFKKKKEKAKKKNNNEKQKFSYFSLLSKKIKQFLLLHQLLLIVVLLLQLLLLKLILLMFLVMLL